MLSLTYAFFKILFEYFTMGIYLVLWIYNLIFIQVIFVYIQKIK